MGGRGLGSRTREEEPKMCEDAVMKPVAVHANFKASKMKGRWETENHKHQSELVYFPVAVTKCSCNSNLKEKGVILGATVQAQPIMVGKSKWQPPEADG